MRSMSVIVVMMIAAILASVVPAKAAKPDPCVTAVPKALRKAIAQQYIGWHMVTAGMLDPARRSRFERQYPSRCPGIAKVRLYGNDRLAYGMVLIKRTRAGTEAKLLVGHTVKGGQWHIIPLEDVEGDPVPVVVRGAPQQYPSQNTRREVLMYLGKDSAPSLYGWNGERIEKLAGP